MAVLELFDVAEACKESGVTRRTLYKWIEDGLDFGGKLGREYLTAVRLGGKYYIDPDALSDFLDLREDFYSEDEDEDEDENEDEED